MQPGQTTPHRAVLASESSVVELLQALSQVAPRAAEPAPPRSSLAQQRGNPNYGSGPHNATVRKQERPSPSAWAEWCPNSEWQPAPKQPNSSARHSWEPFFFARVGALCVPRGTSHRDEFVNTTSRTKPNPKTKHQPNKNNQQHRTKRVRLKSVRV